VAVHDQSGVMCNQLTRLQGVPIQGYWIKAYRNLTSVRHRKNLLSACAMTDCRQAMISDLKQDSVRWRQEQQRTGPKGRSLRASQLRPDSTEGLSDISSQITPALLPTMRPAQVGL
jgi:hypothetical protein